MLIQLCRFYLQILCTKKRFLSEPRLAYQNSEKGNATEKQFARRLQKCMLKSSMILGRNAPFVIRCCFKIFTNLLYSFEQWIKPLDSCCSSWHEMNYSLYSKSNSSIRLILHSNVGHLTKQIPRFILFLFINKVKALKSCTIMRKFMCHLISFSIVASALKNTCDYRWTIIQLDYNQHFFLSWI